MRTSIEKFTNWLKWKLLLIFHGIWALPAVLLIRAFRNLVLIRLGSLTSTRIGHFGLDAAEQFARLKDQTLNTVDWFWLMDDTCNEQLSEMVSRNLPVYSWVKYIWSWNNIIPGGNAHSRPSSYTGSRDIEGLFEKHDAWFPFLHSEDQSSKGWLRKQGWKEGEPFVCLQVRDDSYLEESKLYAHSHRNWSYHSYRNSDIETYVTAMEWLADQGIWVIRMGKIMAKRISTQHPKIIDYAFHDEKSDLLDIWLFANCHFCITTGSGQDCISHIYRKPLLLINMGAIKLLQSYAEVVHVPKIMRWKNSGKELTCSEYWDNSFMETQKYENAGIEIIDLTPETISESVIEFYNRIKGSVVDTENEIERNNKVFNIFQSKYDYSNLHGYIHPKSLIATCWLKDKQENFFV